MVPRSIVVTGASSGIGAALSRHYAGSGVRLCLIGRDAERLERISEECRGQGASVQTALIDVRDRAGMAACLAAWDDEAPIDLVIANAGVAVGGRDLGQKFADACYAQIDINLVGVLNTILPLVPRMAERRSGQIALMSSIAGLVPLPDWAAYSASKAALVSYGLALRQRMAPTVRVNVICPGFITTPMGGRFRGWRPFEMEADAAAKRMAHGLERNKAVIAFPRRLAWAARLSGAIPEPLRRLALSVFRSSAHQDL